jgi:hypothetical protein
MTWKSAGLAGGSDGQERYRTTDTRIFSYVATRLELMPSGKKHSLAVATLTEGQFQCSHNRAGGIS